MTIDYDRAKEMVEKTFSKSEISESATYNGFHIFYMRNKTRPFVSAEPICVNAKTGAIGVYIPRNEEEWRAVAKLLK